MRGAAISQINDALRPGQRVLMTSRTQEYSDAVRPSGAEETTLRGAAAIQLDPLDAETVGHYLQADAGGPAARARWEPIIALLGSNAPVAQALTTPLMAALARTIYNPRPNERIGELQHPVELCGPGMNTRALVEEHLFDAFLPAAYRRYQSGYWTSAQARTWLVFLAQLLEYRYNSPNLLWWQLGRDSRFWRLKVCGGLTAGVVVALLCRFLFDFKILSIGFLGLAPVISGMVSAMAKSPRDPSRRIHFGFRKFGSVFFGYAAMAFACYIVLAGIIDTENLDYLNHWPGSSILSGSFVVVFGTLFVVSLVVGISGLPDEIRSGASPVAVFRRDRRATAVLAVVGITGAIALFIMLTIPFTFAGQDLSVCLIAGAILGLSFGLIAVPLLCVTKSAWPSYKLACMNFALHKQLPWRLMEFLDDAHRRGVLRQLGTVYQFRHIELQRRLASEGSRTAP